MSRIKMYLRGLYLVTMETFVDQKSWSAPSSMIYTTLENAINQQEKEANWKRSACSIAAILKNEPINNLLKFHFHRQPKQSLFTLSTTNAFLQLTNKLLRVKIDHHSKFSNLHNWKEEAWKKSGLQRDSNPWPPRIPVRCSTNRAMKPHIGSEVNLLSSYLPWEVKWREVYMK